MEIRGSRWLYAIVFGAKDYKRDAEVDWPRMNSGKDVKALLRVILFSA